MEWKNRLVFQFFTFTIGKFSRTGQVGPMIFMSFISQSNLQIGYDNRAYKIKKITYLIEYDTTFAN